ncbi:MAG: glycosyltransferase family 4 protein [Acidobacteriota bacterium]|jgi:glycosyltransferase involved in cell wall biosynthesis
MTPSRLLFVDQAGALGGAELFLLDVAERFRSRGRVLLFEDGPFRARLLQAGVDVEVMDGVRGLSRLTKAGGPGRMLRSLPSMLKGVTMLRRRARKADLVYLNTAKALVLGATASRLAGTPYIYHLHDLVSSDHFGRWNRRLLVELGNRAVAVIANSEATRAAFVESGGHPDLVSVVYNGFDCERFDRELAEGREGALRLREGIGDGFLVTVVGRIAPWKGQHVLLEAVRRLPDVHACVAGAALFTADDQRYEARLREMSQEASLRGRVRFTGFREDIPGILAVSDVIVHCSVAPEPFGRVIVEGLLAGRPVIAADAGGAREIVDAGRTGWLVQPGDPEGLASAIADVRRDPGRAAGIAAAGREEVRTRFGLERILEQVEGIVSRCLSSPERPGTGNR